MCWKEVNSGDLIAKKRDFRECLSERSWRHRAVKNNHPSVFWRALEILCVLDILPALFRYEKIASGFYRFMGSHLCSFLLWGKFRQNWYFHFLATLTVKFLIKFWVGFTLYVQHFLFLQIRGSFGGSFLYVSGGNYGKSPYAFTKCAIANRFIKSGTFTLLYITYSVEYHFIISAYHLTFFNSVLTFRHILATHTNQSSFVERNL